ncbi:hypothetical protein M409DRAFT_54604 [Zasmidium cellare ATCC 36951]|uniref:Lysine-specific metallo-endopeptidase domain-containing protein n=1 Tax=Zasmidium cellare ATCC 36951 TaxID=1080233 RepID=A0A6A6CJN4_ZASCE|nr:uncharacterized protein M409DRAFT_54604 [Zasmidium cellare ATCC 36951]KAF2166823.1 hypothetical protein M409DRAFT_54604 [Zasmidium cellare ATCC 36951]
MKIQHLCPRRVFLLACLLHSAEAVILVDPVHNTCGAQGSSTVQGLLTDVTNLAQHALNSMNSLDNGQSSGWDFYRTVVTFDSFFDATSPGAQTRWNDVKSNLGTMAAAPSTTRNVYVSCDDSALWTQAQDGTLTFNDPSNGQSYPGYSTATTKRCADPVIINGTPNTQIGYRIQINNIEFVQLCLKQNGGDILLNQLSLAEGNNLDDETTLSTVLFHELTHALIDTMRGDSTGGQAAGGERYGWGGAQQVRSTYAVENPDSLTLYTLAMALTPYLWNTGKALSTVSEYQRLQQNEPQTIRNLNLPSS